MRFRSTGSLLVACAALVVVSELSEAMLLLPLVIRRAAARRHLGERLLDEIKKIDFPNLSGQSIQRRRSTTDSDPDRANRPSHKGAAATTGHTDLSSPERATMSNEVAARKSNQFVAPPPRELSKVGLFGDTDWAPGPRRQRNCEARMMAGLSGMRILGRPAKCLDGGGGDDEGDGGQADAKWKLEGPIADYEDFYLKKKPEAQKFTAKFERVLDELLVKPKKAGAAATPATPAPLAD